MSPYARSSMSFSSSVGSSSFAYSPGSCRQRQQLQHSQLCLVVMCKSPYNTRQIAQAQIWDHQSMGKAATDLYHDMAGRARQ